MVPADVVMYRSAMRWIEGSVLCVIYQCYLGMRKLGMPTRMPRGAEVCLRVP